jgi:hypothetical protein
VIDFVFEHVYVRFDAQTWLGGQLDEAIFRHKQPFQIALPRQLQVFVNSSENRMFWLETNQFLCTGVTDQCLTTFHPALPHRHLWEEEFR